MPASDSRRRDPRVTRSNPGGRPHRKVQRAADGAGTWTAELRVLHSHEPPKQKHATTVASTRFLQIRMGGILEAVPAVGNGQLVRPQTVALATFDASGGDARNHFRLKILRKFR